MESKRNNLKRRGSVAEILERDYFSVVARVPLRPLYSKDEFERQWLIIEDFIKNPESYDLSQDRHMSSALAKAAEYRDFAVDEEPRLVRFCTSVLIALAETRLCLRAKELIEHYFEFLVQKLLCRHYTVPLRDKELASSSVVSQDGPKYLYMLQLLLTFDDLQRFAWTELTSKTLLMASILGRCLAYYFDNVRELIWASFNFLRVIGLCAKESCFVSTGICTSFKEVLHKNPEKIMFVEISGVHRPLVLHALSHKDFSSECVHAYLELINVNASNIRSSNTHIVDAGVLDVLDAILASQRSLTLLSEVIDNLIEFFDSGPHILQRVVEHNVINTLTSLVAHENDTVVCRARVCVQIFLRRAERTHIFAAIMNGLADTICGLLVSTDRAILHFGLKIVQKALRKYYSRPAEETAQKLNASELRGLLRRLSYHPKLEVGVLALGCLTDFPSPDGNDLARPELDEPDNDVWYKDIHLE